jgi:CHAT domain-containing protein
VALGDPDGGTENELPAARAEVAEIAHYFDADSADIKLGPAADSDFLRSAAPGATHLHLACHGSAGMLDSSQAGVWLADGLLGAEEIAELGLQARVSIVSACQGATPDINALPEEASSTATAFLAAGSASVVAALWPVDDIATALLMVKFHELLVGHPDQPVQALRGAQLWLRDLTEAEEGAFAAAHPEIAGHLRARAAAGRAPGRRGHVGSSAAAVCPYPHPYFWAAFIVAGT